MALAGDICAPPGICSSLRRVVIKYHNIIDIFLCIDMSIRNIDTLVAKSVYFKICFKMKIKILTDFFNSFHHQGL